MDKLKMQSPNLVEGNIDKIAALFPNCITENKDENGIVQRAVDFDLLRQELSPTLVEGPRERYSLSWPGKNDAILVANAPIAKTLRPCEEESVDFANTKNIYIEGDNLEALKLLQETYLNKVKIIYIDPPYNTGKDFIYTDTFAVDKNEYELITGSRDEVGNKLFDEEKWKQNLSSRGRFHSNWLNMMYSRLKLAKNILADDGVLFISIDEVEHANLRKIATELFGEDNFVGDIIWKNSSKNDQDYISMQHEYILCFVKNKTFNRGEWKEKKEGLQEIYQMFDGLRKKYGNDWAEIHKQALKWYNQYPESNPIYDSKHYSWLDEEGVYFPDNISGPNVGQYVYDVIHPTTKKVVKAPSRGWFCPEATMLDLIKKNRIHFGPDETTVPCLKTYLKNTENKSLTSMIYKDGRAASKRLTSLFGENIFTNPKDETVLVRLFKAIGVKDGDIIFDFFSGSSTAAHAVLLLSSELDINCRFVMVQLPEDLTTLYNTATGVNKKIVKNAINYLETKKKPLNICEIGKERIRLAGKNILNEHKSAGKTQNLDIGFRVLKIDSSNMKDVFYTPDALKQGNLDLFKDHIKPDRRPEDLLFQVFIEWGLDLSLTIAKENIDGKNIFIVDTDALVACFETGITEELVKKLAKYTPLRVVFRDDAFASDSVKINVEQIFKLLSPGTEVKAI